MKYSKLILSVGTCVLATAAFAATKASKYLNVGSTTNGNGPGHCNATQYATQATIAVNTPSRVTATHATHKLYTVNYFRQTLYRTGI